MENHSSASPPDATPEHFQNEPVQFQCAVTPACCRLGAKWKILGAALLFGLSLLFWPADRLVLRPYTPGGAEQPPLFAALAPLGQECGTGYIHSLQRTPVLDVYRIAGGRLWSWREYVQSHNAGLPFQAPASGRFRMLHPWMAIEGGRQAWPRIVLRVGNAALGRNVFAWEEAGDRLLLRLHEAWPGKRLTLGVERLPLAVIHLTRAISL